MEIKGIQKVTLLDYPGKVACTVFTGGCNFRCPFCQNSDLVISPALVFFASGAVYLMQYAYQEANRCFSRTLLNS